MSVSRKYQQYLKQFPINIEWRLTLTQDTQGFIRDNTTYFGPLNGSMKNGSYGISFQKKINGGLIIRQGSWKQDKMNGKGSAYYIPEPCKKQPSIIVWKQGEWNQDLLHGRGIIRIYNTNQKEWKTVYNGNFLNNFKNGSGIYFFDDMMYEGQFENDCFNGQGRLTKNHEYFYSGSFKNGRPFGKGVQRRGEEVIVYDQTNQSKAFIIPSQTEQLPTFYKTIISQI